MQVRYIKKTIVSNFPRYELIASTNQNVNGLIPNYSDYIIIDDITYKVIHREVKIHSDDAVNGKIYNSVDIFMEEYSEREQPTIL